MLIEFRVRNYRSFKDESVLSLAASNDRDLADTNTTSTGIKAIPRTVRSAVIYGANASGKSNLLRALQLMRGVVVDSVALTPSQLFNVQPFRLCRNTPNEPTLFEVTILIDAVRYQYGFEFTASQITSEWLFVYQKNKPQKWFERKYNPSTKQDDFTFGSHLQGAKRTWQESTRSNALFLSTAIHLNSDQLKPLFSWFSDKLNVLLGGGQISPEYSASMAQTKTGQNKIASLLAAADTGISSVRVEPTKGKVQSFKIDLKTGAAEAMSEDKDMLMPKFQHMVGETRAEFDLGDESEGTQKLFALAGPLYTILEAGSILVIDELDRSLHPLLVRQIIEAFQNPDLNTRQAQLIFTTHDTSLLDNALLRRDQIWFAEKTADQSSQLMPLTEFSPRKGEALEKNYLVGRYGGVPILEERLLKDRNG
jgi:AAA15 family ATPase/GTPase